MIYSSPYSCKVRLTGGYPYYDSDGLTHNSHRMHTGEDYVPSDKSKEENWNLFAIGDGEVIKNSGSGAYGNHIIIRTDAGQVVLYAHMQSRSSFKVGARVKKGYLIGVTGATGNVTGRHLHIEVQDSTTWKYGKNLVKPSSVIDFNDFAKEVEPDNGGEFEMPKIWTNGSTKEKVYQTTTDCKRGKKSIGSLSPRESCDCYAIIDGCYLVSYKVDGTTAKKAGFVEYHGGVNK